MTDLREKLACTLWHNEAARSAPNVARGRTPEEFSGSGDESRVPWLHHADAIIAALPDMVTELTWFGHEADRYVVSALGPSYYEVLVTNRLAYPCDYLWSAYYSGKRITVEGPPQQSFAEAKAIANAHHRAQVMRMLGVEV